MNTFTEPLRVRAHRLFDGAVTVENAVLEIVQDRISRVIHDDKGCDIELPGTLVPGFVDLQVNGGGGALFNASPSLATVERIASAHYRYGTTSFLPTVITDNIDKMRQAADAISDCISEGTPGVLGIHYEGPFISEIKKGAHSEKYIRAISDAELEIFSRKDIGKILVTIAPENVSPSDIGKLVDLGVVVSIGHTNASFDCVQNAINAGASGFTHLFNAMSPLNSREPGVTGAALLDDTTMCGLIVDGHHVAIPSCKLALKSKPKGGIYLVTDAMPPVGTSQRSFDFFDRRVFLKEGKLISSTGELAGSSLNMAAAVKNCIHLLDISFDEAIRMASLYPFLFIKRAGFLPIPNSPMLRGGLPANFVQLDEELNVVSTWIGGKMLYDSSKDSLLVEGEI